MGVDYVPRYKVGFGIGTFEVVTSTILDQCLALYIPDRVTKKS